MHYRTFAAFCLALAVAFGGLSTVIGQDKPPKDDPAKKEEPPKKDDTKKEDEKKDDVKKDDKKDEPKKEDLLDEKAYEKLMTEDIRAAWNKAKANIRNKRGEETGKNADELAKLSAKILLSDTAAKAGKNKGKKLREQKDFQDWANELKTAAEELSKQAKAGKWDKVDVEKEKIGKTCTNCHDVYNPQ
jgi:hypothetical protein